MVRNISSQRFFLCVSLADCIVIIEFINFFVNNLVSSSTSLLTLWGFLQFKISVWILHSLIIINVNSAFDLLWCEHFTDVLSLWTRHLRVKRSWSYSFA